MTKNKNAFSNKTLNQLKKEYNLLALGAMIYDADTEAKRRKLIDEIDRREGREPFDWDKTGDEKYIMEYSNRNGGL